MTSLGYTFKNKVAKLSPFPENESNVHMRCVCWIISFPNELKARLLHNMELLQHISLFNVEESVKHKILADMSNFTSLLECLPSKINKVIKQWRNLLKEKNRILEYRDKVCLNQFEGYCCSLCNMKMKMAWRRLDKVLQIETLRNLMMTTTNSIRLLHTPLHSLK